MMLRPPHYIGHNPAGSLMIFALFAVLTALVVTGLMVQGGEEKQGPLAGSLATRIGDARQALARVLASALLLAMIVGHVAGVLVEGRLLRIPLIRGMITGWMPLPTRHCRLPAARACRVRSPRWSRSAFSRCQRSLGCSAAGRGCRRRHPGHAARRQRCPPNAAPATGPSIRASCRAPPGRRLMAGLDDHFGEDASLPAEPGAARSRPFSTAMPPRPGTPRPRAASPCVGPSEPLRITATPFWIAKHAGIARRRPSPRAPVGPRPTASACHRTPLSGRFDDQAIAMPATAQEVAP